jgi:hypothetical protein
LCGTTSVANDDEQQQIQVAFSQQLICNPKILLIQGRRFRFIKFEIDLI